MAPCDLDAAWLSGAIPVAEPFPPGHVTREAAAPAHRMLHARALIPDVLALTAAGRLEPALVTSAVVRFDEAPRTAGGGSSNAA